MLASHEQEIESLKTLKARAKWKERLELSDSANFQASATSTNGEIFCRM